MMVDEQVDSDDSKQEDSQARTGFTVKKKFAHEKKKKFRLHICQRPKKKMNTNLGPLSYNLGSSTLPPEYNFFSFARFRKISRLEKATFRYSSLCAA